MSMYEIYSFHELRSTRYYQTAFTFQLFPRRKDQQAWKKYNLEAHAAIFLPTDAICYTSGSNAVMYFWYIK